MQQSLVLEYIVHCCKEYTQVGKQQKNGERERDSTNMKSVVDR